MSEQDECILSLYNDNNRQTFLEVSEALLLVCDDLLHNPTSSNYRLIRVSSRLIQDKFLPNEGAIQCLFTLGYREGGEYFVLPEDTNLNLIRKFRSSLTAIREKCLKEMNQNFPKTEKLPNPVNSLPNKENVSTNLAISEARFLDQLNSYMEVVLLCEDHTLQQEALKSIPKGDLQNKAKEKYSMLKKQQTSLSISIQDCLLVELLYWFKFHFFTWVDTLTCVQCAENTVANGTFPPTNKELKWLASRIEKHFCKSCQISYRFPRYSHPRQLLKTRKGRCGEWAKCFTLLCRALGFESRLIIDWTDHVWTEVYSMSGARWVHCDPCENSCDMPLLYECGWSKKLSYIIGFSKDEIQDVTWRYTINQKDVLLRRMLCRESWLLEQISYVTNKLQVNLSDRRKNELLHRKIKELVEFLSVRAVKNEELVGRTSGSLDWRISRSEVGLSDSNKSFIFQLKKPEIDNKHFQVKYSSALDKYIRVSCNWEEIGGWQNCVYKENNIFYKTEHDWKMTYLARRKGTSDANISWRFDFSDVHFIIDNVVLRCEHTCFENGSVSLSITTDNGEIPLDKVSGPVTVEKLNGASRFTIYCELKDGKGENSWQHAQLFRQAMDSNDFPFDVKISFI